MGKCKYCYLLPDGDIPEDTKDILDKNISRVLDIRIGNAGNDFGIIVQNSKKELLYQHDLGFKFCPMCGRKLEKGGE